MTNKEVKDFCEKHSLTVNQFYGREKIEGSLYLSSVTEIPEGFNPTVGMNLYLNSVKKIPKGFNPIVGASLDLSSIKELPKGFSPTVGGSLYLNSVKELPKDFNPTVGSSLYLSSITKLPEYFNPTVGNYLDLSSLTKLPEDFNPTIGGGIIYNNTYIEINHDLPILSWQNGKYIKVDGIFCEVLHKKDNIYKCKYLNKETYFYVVTDGNKTYAHGESIKEAQSDLLYNLSKEM